MNARAHVSLALGLVLAACATATPDNISVACARGRPGPIEGEWALVRIDGAAWTFTRATLLAEAQGFAGTLGCNGFGTSEPVEGGAHYTVASGRLELKGDIVVTTLFCGSPGLMVFEGVFVDLLDDQPHVARGDDLLCLYTDDGRSLEFQRVAEVDS